MDKTAILALRFSVGTMLFCLLSLPAIHGQRAYFDSVAANVDYMEDDSARLISLFDLTKGYTDQPERVKEYGKKALELANAFEDIDKYVRANYFVGKAYNETHQPKIALDYLSQAQQRITDTIAAQPILKNIFKESGVAKLQLFKYAEARKDFERAMAIFEQQRDKKNIAFLEYRIGETYLGEGDYDRAVVFFKESERSYDNLKMTSKVIESMAKTGMTYIEAKNSTLALNQFKKALARAERAKDEQAIGIAKRYMAVFYNEKDFFDEGLKWQEAALAHFKTAKDTFNIAFTHSEIGLTLTKMNELEKGFDHEIEALQLFSSIQNQEFVANSKNNLAKHYIKIIGNEEAIKYLNDAIEINSKLNKNLAVADNQLNLGYVFYQTRKYKNVITHSNASLNSAYEVQHIESMKKAALLLSRTYKETGQFEKAVSTMELFDSLYRVENNLRLKKLTNQIEGNYKKYENEVKKVENASFFKVLFWILLVAILALAAMGFYFYKKNNISLLKNQPLHESPSPPSMQKTVIEPSDNNSPLPVSILQKEKKETPLNWKQPLELLSSIISIQSLTQRDELSVHEYKMEQARLHAIQLIQERIQKDPNTELFDFEEYSTQMIDFLSKMHRNQTGIIDYQIKAKQQTSVFQTAILGLISAELVSNAATYAFDGKLKGIVKVELEKRANNWLLKVSNNGKNTTDNIDKKQGLGLKIVHLLANQLNGKLEMEQKKDWTEFKVSFKS